MEAKTREHLYRLVDRIPADEVHAAERYLEFLADVGDPFVRALLGAPMDTERLTDEDRAALDEGREALANGDTVTDEELRVELRL